MVFRYNKTRYLLMTLHPDAYELTTKAESSILDKELLSCLNYHRAMLFFVSECNIVQYLNFSSSITWTMFVSIYDCGTNNFMEKDLPQIQ